MGQFRFRRHAMIGSADAEADDAFLKNNCFIDASERLQILRDCADQRSIVGGRTGAGKTALLTMLVEWEERAIPLNVRHLAIEYIANSTVLSSFEAAGVKLDILYQFLWRHVFAIELIKARFGLESEEQRPKFWEHLSYRVRGKQKYLDAFRYLNTWGTNFWSNTEATITQIIDKIEKDTKITASVTLWKVISLGAEGVRKLSQEERTEIKQRGQEIIKSLQLSQLAAVITALDEDLLTANQKHYYIVVDRLDDPWIDDQRRYPLIRALIETMRDMNSHIRNAKIIIALRTDLLQRVLKATTDPGFQYEKYRDLVLPVTWTAAELEQVLDQRVNTLVKHQYTGQPVSYQELLPRTIGSKKTPAITYLLERTLLRPRDLIILFNYCIEEAENEPRIAVKHLGRAEKRYSEARLVSLYEEWGGLYPCLKAMCHLLKKRPDSFKLGALDDRCLDELCLRLMEAPDEMKPGEDVTYMKGYFESRVSAPELRAFIAQVLYRLGVIGLKTETYREITWSHLGQGDFSLDDITDQTTIYVHKMFWRALGTITGREHELAA